MRCPRRLPPNGFQCRLRLAPNRIALGVTRRPTRGNHANGTETTRPSDNVTDGASFEHDTTPSVSALSIKIAMPFLQEELLVLHNDLPYLGHLVPAKASDLATDTARAKTSHVARVRERTGGPAPQAPAKETRKDPPMEPTRAQVCLRFQKPGVCEKQIMGWIFLKTLRPHFSSNASSSSWVEKS